MKTILNLIQHTISPQARFEITDKEDMVYRAPMEGEDIHDFWGFDNSSTDEEILKYIKDCSDLNDMKVGDVHWDAFGSWIVYRLPDAE